MRVIVIICQHNVTVFHLQARRALRAKQRRRLRPCGAFVIHDKLMTVQVNRDDVIVADIKQILIRLERRIALVLHRVGNIACQRDRRLVAVNSAPQSLVCRHLRLFGKRRQRRRCQKHQCTQDYTEKPFHNHPSCSHFNR